MREIFDWKIVYEALSGIPHQFGAQTHNSVVIATLEIEGSTAMLSGAVRVDGEVISEPGVILDILEAQMHYGSNGALIAVVHPQGDAGIERFFDELTDHWPMDYHAGYVVQTPDAIAASCACGDEIELGDELELLATVTTSINASRPVWGCDTDLRVERTAGAKRAETMAGLLADVPTPIDTREVTELIVSRHGRWTPLTMAQKATVVRALEIVDFRDGFLSWASSRADAPKDFERYWADYELPDHTRIEHAIRFLTGLCRWLPEGDAAAPIASAAYLAWYSGHGTQARVLTEQAAEEDREYSLTALMNRILAHAAPPPWVTHRHERLVS